MFLGQGLKKFFNNLVKRHQQTQNDTKKRSRLFRVSVVSPKIYRPQHYCEEEGSICERKDLEQSMSHSRTIWLLKQFWVSNTMVRFLTSNWSGSMSSLFLYSWTARIPNNVRWVWEPLSHSHSCKTVLWSRPQEYLTSFFQTYLRWHWLSFISLIVPTVSLVCRKQDKVCPSQIVWTASTFRWGFKKWRTEV